MAKVDFNSLDIDARIGRKRQICGKCGELMAVTTTCSLRENKTVTVKEGFKKVKKKLSPVICWHCCLKCGYAIIVPGGSQCSIKLNRQKKAEELRQAEKAKRKKKAARQHDAEAEYSFFDSIED